MQDLNSWTAKILEDYGALMTVVELAFAMVCLSVVLQIPLEFALFQKDVSNFCYSARGYLLAKFVSDSPVLLVQTCLLTAGLGMFFEANSARLLRFHGGKRNNRKRFSFRDFMWLWRFRVPNREEDLPGGRQGGRCIDKLWQC